MDTQFNNDITQSDDMDFEYTDLNAHMQYNDIDTDMDIGSDWMDYDYTEILMRQASQMSSDNLLNIDAFINRGESIDINGHQYTIIKKIEDGADGRAVYQVLNHTFSLMCALKRIPINSLSDRMDVLNEIEMHQSLQNENAVVRLYDAFISHNVACLIMELGEGDLIDGFLYYRERSVDMNSIRRCWREMVVAVYALHRNNIIHRDIKPNNFVVFDDALKLIDFGTAARVGDGESVIEGPAVGTFDYMAPETMYQIDIRNGQSIVSVGFPSDVWSLGTSLYEMIYDDIRTGGNREPVIWNPYYQFQFAPTVQLRGVTVAVPEDLLQAMRDCLAFYPQHRKTCEGLLNDLLANRFIL